MYDLTIRALGLKDLSPEERIKSLLAIPHERILESLPPAISFLPLIDGDLFPAAMTFEELSSPKQENLSLLPGFSWCKSLLIGDCQFDVSHRPSFQASALLTPFTLHHTQAPETHRPQYSTT
jgi:hypothetical protein